MELYDELKAAGVELDSHESDLYFPVTPETTAILARHPLEQKIATTFKHTEHKTKWYDVPFAFLPFWRGKGSVEIALADVVLEWARESRNHGGNPYLYKFVQLAQKIKGEL